MKFVTSFECCCICSGFRDVLHYSLKTSMGEFLINNFGNPKSKVSFFDGYFKANSNIFLHLFFLYYGDLWSNYSIFWRFGHLF